MPAENREADVYDALWYYAGGDFDNKSIVESIALIAGVAAKTAKKHLKALVLSGAAVTVERYLDGRLRKFYFLTPKPGMESP